jgi:hypothetical protein
MVILYTNGSYGDLVGIRTCLSVEQMSASSRIRHALPLNRSASFKLSGLSKRVRINASEWSCGDDPCGDMPTVADKLYERSYFTFASE